MLVQNQSKQGELGTEGPFGNSGRCGESTAYFTARRQRRMDPRRRVTGTGSGLRGRDA